MNNMYRDSKENKQVFTGTLSANRFKILILFLTMVVIKVAEMALTADSRSIRLSKEVMAVGPRLVMVNGTITILKLSHCNPVNLLVGVIVEKLLPLKQMVRPPPQ
jgi:hypothetical protein